nr:reverse transcriptase domain-containing protein [Tanacetum cinerariifolium]GEU68886.1 reverse transcriptase domain-containing protein [Tanacetum cinerariifolium]
LAVRSYGLSSGDSDAAGSPSEKVVASGNHVSREGSRIVVEVRANSTLSNGIAWDVGKSDSIGTECSKISSDMVFIDYWCIQVMHTFDMKDDVDISALTMEQYIALIPDEIKPGIVKPKIGDDVEFEINENFMRKLRRKLFAGTDDEDAYEHFEMRVHLILNEFEKLYAKFSKCEFWLQEVHFHGHMVNQNGIHVDPSYYRRFIVNFSKIAKPLTSLTQKTKDHKSLQHILDYKELNMRQRRWIKLFSDYECEIHYHPAQSEAFKQENVLAKRLHGLDQQMERKEDESLYFIDRIWVPLVGGVRTIIMDEAHKTRVPVSIISDRDGRFTLRFWQTLQKALGTRLDMSTTYHPQTDGQSENTIQTLKDMLRAYVINFRGNWDVHLPLNGPELVQETIDKVVLIKENLKAVRNHQKSYADNRRKLLEFKVGDRVLLNVSPWKGVVCFEKKDKLAPRSVWRMLICMCHWMIMDRKVRSLKRSKISLVKVRWNSKRGSEFIWEREDNMKFKSRDEIFLRMGYCDNRDLSSDNGNDDVFACIATSIIRNFKQEKDETLYHALERYNDLLYQCPLHDLNYQQKVHILYNGLDISTRKILNSKGFIPLLTPTQALESIQVMTDHSHDWYDETTTRERINDVMDNIDAIHKSFKGKHLTKEYPLKKRTRQSSIEDIFLTEQTVRMIGNPKEIHNEKAQEDEGDIDVSWEITSKEVERLRQFLTPTIHTLPNLEPVMQPYIPLGLVHDKIIRDEEQDYDIPLNDSILKPLTPQTVHITPPDDDYVAPATNPMSNKQLNKFE